MDDDEGDSKLTGPLDNSPKTELYLLTPEQDATRSSEDSEGCNVSEFEGTSSGQESEDDSDDPQASLRYRMIAQRINSEMVCCTNDDFMNHYLPPVPDTVDIDEVMADLLEGKYLEESRSLEGDRQITLISFQAKPLEERRGQKGMRANGKAIFSSIMMVDMAIAIRQFIGASQNPFSLRSVTDTIHCPSTNGSSFKIDACTTVNASPSGVLDVTDVVVPFQFKLHNDHKSRQKNRRQVVSAVVHIMNEDARRNFVYAVTIEDDRLSMWYFSRTHSVKATSFNFVKDPIKLVRLLTSLSCATDEQLGYDTRITLLPDRSFLYEFPPAESAISGATLSLQGDKASGVDTALGESAAANAQQTAEGDGTPQPKPIYYKTIEALSDCAYRVAGRTTRIFKCKQVVSKDDPTPVPGAEDVVVKDIWVGVDSPTELQIQQQLFEDIENLRIEYPNGLAAHDILGDFEPHEASELDSWLCDYRYKDLFLCVDSESVGEGNKAAHPEAWDSDDIFVLETPYSGESYAGTGDRITLSMPPTVAPQSSLGPAEHIPSSRRGFSPKKRCFYVFKQVCTRVSALPKLGDAISVLRHTYLALMLMFCAGWVHRDISHGNILASTEEGGKSWQGRLADLEHARKFPSEDAGSKDPKTGTPFFMAYEIRSTLSLYDPTKATCQGFHGRRAKADRERKGTELRVVEKHTYAHDLESLWWLVLWIITNLLAHHESYAKAYIYFQLNDISSRLALLRQGALPIADPRVHNFREPLNTVREALMAGYEQRNPESEELEDVSSYQGVCIDFYDFFAEVKKSQTTWESIPLQDPASRPVTQPVARASVFPQAAGSNPQVSATTQFGARKRKGMEETSTPKPTVRRPHLRAAVKALQDPEAGAEGPGPSKRTRT